MDLDNCTVPTGLASLSWSSVGSTESFSNSSEERPRPCQGSGSAKRARYAHAPGDSPSEMELDAEPNDNMDIDVDCVGGLPESHTTMELDSDFGMAPPPMDLSPDGPAMHVASSENDCRPGNKTMLEVGWAEAAVVAQVV